MNVLCVQLELDRDPVWTKDDNKLEHHPGKPVKEKNETRWESQILMST